MTASVTGNSQQPDDVETSKKKRHFTSPAQKAAALTIGIAAALLTIGMNYWIGSSVEDARAVVVLTLPGLLGAMAVGQNVHAFSLGVAATINGVFYCSLTLVTCGGLNALAKKLREFLG
jgi:hypothetical protein